MSVAPGPFRRDQIVFHKTFGPGRVVSASFPTIEVEFHDGRRETLRRSYAEETLVACSDDGFSARILADKQAVCRTLEEDPREVFKWLSRDLHREITARTAKPLLKALNVLPGEALQAAWHRATRKLQSQPPKRRIEDQAVQVSGEVEAKELESKLWDTGIHILSRNTIYKALTEFHEPRADENFFLRVLFSPVPVARAHAYGLFKKRGGLEKVWEYLIRKNVDPRSAAGMLDIWFRLVGGASSEHLRVYGDRAVEIFLELQVALPLRNERLDSLRRLVALQTGAAFSVGKAVVARLPRQSWEDALREMSAEESRRAFQLYFQGVISNLEEGKAVEALTWFLSTFVVESLPELVVTVADFARSAGRVAFVRRFLQASAEVIARRPEIHDTGLGRLRAWLMGHRDLLSEELGRFFSALGYPVEDRPAHLDRVAHVGRLGDASLPLAVRERSVEEVAPRLSGLEVVTLAGTLLSERSTNGQNLLAAVWSRWARSREASASADVFVAALLGGDSGGLVHMWALTRAQEAGVAEHVAELLSQRIQARRMGETLDPEIRTLLTEVRDQTLGRLIRDRVLTTWSRADRSESQATPLAVKDAVVLLGIAPDVYAFIEHLIGASKQEVDTLSGTVRRLEEKLADILSSAETRSEIRRLVDESLGAREAQLREEWERDLETTRLDVANLYVDLAAFVDSARPRLGEDARAVADILIRRLEQLLSSRLDMKVIGRVGETVRFDADLHQTSAGNAAEGGEVVILRPGIRKVGSSGVVSKAVVKRQRSGIGGEPWRTDDRPGRPR